MSPQHFREIPPPPPSENSHVYSNNCVKVHPNATYLGKGEALA